MKTTWPKPSKENRKWWIIDAKGKVLGRLSTKVATLLVGKDKVDYDKSVDMGDCVVVINASKVKVTGGKKDKKIYHWHTPYPGGIRSRTLGETLKRKPEWVIENSVRLMLPANKMRSLQMARLHVVAGEDHKYSAQKPELIEEIDKVKSK